MHSFRPTISTRTYAMLRDAVDTALQTARMVLAIGPAGIGKTFALDLVAAELNHGEDEVYVYTASESTSRSETKFFHKLLFDLNVSGAGSVDPMEVFEAFILRSYPFRGHGARKVLVIDECQYLQTKIVNCLKYFYDRGDMARKYDVTRGAFGLVFVGNAFLSKGGKDTAAAYDALNTRMSRWPLGRPADLEIATLSARYFPDNDALQSELTRAGVKWSNFREMAEAVSIASHFAGDSAIELTHLRAAIKVVGGKA